MLRMRKMLTPSKLRVNGKYWFIHNGTLMKVRYRGEAVSIHGTRYRFEATSGPWRDSEWRLPFRSVQEKVTVRV